MLTLLSQIPLDRALLVLFLAGQLWEKFKSTRRSLQDQGRRIGGAERELAEIVGRLAALEASRNRAP